jgi:CheY-like chemotaxis protein
MNHEHNTENLAILCVDDEQVILTSLTEQIRSHFGKRFSYETALDGEEALEVLDELCDEGIKTIVIVSDWLMPGMKGDELLVQIHQRFPQTVKVMLTGQADSAAVERAKREANLYSYLQKPWSREELLQVLEDGLKSLKEND